MTNTQIAEYTQYYVVSMKDWEQFEVSEKIWIRLQDYLQKEKPEFVKIGNDLYNRFEIKSVKPRKVVDGIQAYIMTLPKEIRDKLNFYAETNKVKWNSIEHVSNVVEAIRNWKI